MNGRTYIILLNKIFDHILVKTLRMKSLDVLVLPDLGQFKNEKKHCSRNIKSKTNPMFSLTSASAKKIPN